MNKALSSTAVYAYTTLISVLICVPLALFAEGKGLMAGVDSAIAAVGAQRFYTDLFMVGLLYHLYNQVRVCISSTCLAANTLCPNAHAHPFVHHVAYLIFDCVLRLLCTIHIHTAHADIFM
jgi:hypothetical protein